MPGVSDILSAIAEERALALFDSVAHTAGGTDQLVRELKLSRKEYYSRMSRFIKAGLVKRYKGRYSLTMLGKLVSAMQNDIELAVKNYWRLETIDKFEKMDEIPTGEREKILNNLLHDKALKNLLKAYGKLEGA